MESAGEDAAGKLVIRRATGADAEGILAVLNPIIEAGIYSALDTPFTVESERAFLEGLSERDLFQVAVEAGSGRIVGMQDVAPFATYTGAFAHVGVIGTFVDLGRRRQGIGKALFRATFAAAVELGYEKLFTYIRADNPAALATYQAHGFGIVGTAKRHTKLRGRYVDEILVERFL